MTFHCLFCFTAGSYWTKNMFCQSFTHLKCVTFTCGESCDLCVFRCVRPGELHIRDGWVRRDESAEHRGAIWCGNGQLDLHSIHETQTQRSRRDHTPPAHLCARYKLAYKHIINYHFWRSTWRNVMFSFLLAGIKMCFDRSDHRWTTLNTGVNGVWDILSLSAFNHFQV